MMLVERLAEAIAHQEGFYLSEAYAQERGLTFPTRAQRNANPGNIRVWKTGNGHEYPRSGGYVDFTAWAAERPGAVAALEGWRVLRLLVWRYIEGRYTHMQSPTLVEMFRVYSPSADGNEPEAYASAVGARLGIPTDVPLSKIQAEQELAERQARAG